MSKIKVIPNVFSRSRSRIIDAKSKDAGSDRPPPSSPRRTAKTGGEKLDAIVSNAKSAINVANSVLSNFSVPGLSTALSIVDQLLDRVAEVRANAQDKVEVIEKIKTLVTLLGSTAKDITSAMDSMTTTDRCEAQEQIKGSDVVKSRVEELVSKLESTLTATGEEQHKNWLSRTWYSRQDAQALDRIRQRIIEATDNFKLQEGITFQQLLYQIMESTRRLERETREYHLRSEDELPSYKSQYVEYKAKLQPGTRKRILKEVLDWAKDPNQTRRMQVVYGPAGVGKSAIAREISEVLASGYLGASFFFQRGIAECNDPYLVIPTLIFQLAHSRPELQRHIADAVEKHMQYGDSQGITHQARELIFDLFSQLDPLDPPLVFVIDGVDECLNSPEGVIQEMLEILCKMAEQIPSLRIVIATRPETYIMDALPSLDNTSAVMRDLWVDSEGEIDGDIRLYIQAEFDQCAGRGGFTLLKERPDCVAKLTQLSGGLFIYASTVVRFLVHDRRLAVDIYDRLLESQGSQAPSRLHGRLDMLYTTILNNAFVEFREDRKRMEYIHFVLQWFIIIPEDCAARCLNPIVPPSVTMDVMDRLRSVLAIQGDITPTTNMKPCHASFPQFLIDITRCQDADFFVDVPIARALIAGTLLDVLARHNVTDLPRDGDGGLLWVWGYARRNWVDRLLEAPCTAQLAGSLRLFTETHLDRWLANIWPWDHLYRRAEAVDKLTEVRNWCEERNLCDGELVVLLDGLIGKRAKEIAGKVPEWPREFQEKDRERIQGWETNRF
ncbi:hypothetical protein OBBRIDRAFT_103371 [Obba rivulosa]|uniref:NACHT domain-containing protein n=1 Tax=Obba rivulosa TaxID=1052685 RepID=A0A8E2DRX1_9APHY|nr:hypothetical protein OBBRIDRAFT_103371 [Obba rivulosa]